MRVPDELWQRAKDKAEQEKESVSAVIVEALEVYVAAVDNDRS